MSTAAPDPGTDAVIRAVGLRATAPRRAVFDALRGMPHSRADEIFARVQRDSDGTSLQSVYNVLGDFVDAGLVRRIEPAGSPGLFEVRVDDNHHHLVCTSCSRVEDVACSVGAAPCLHPVDTHGYQIHTAEVTYWGLCSACAADANSSASSRTL
ncbi:Fur family ferric uptake transcriptional regulator [Microbacterium endophyticum]|uniref:Fur family ferric uptake transcriptional regulator n=1 Tax=Microbacterium endophyticum TaxID=1526412 RepID=A0A7W4V3S9_9MICO|nr:Fur family transcriptional regulator [Microbacterium endophyticum]MBB2976317.1 Fur family ferric uptake transcriptional regulator [Microbacterium endophyticum]NIK35197.1 Fur family ferric uptake transcriptional regulator [Microbacterium endophyticum]